MTLSSHHQYIESERSIEVSEKENKTWRGMNWEAFSIIDITVVVVIVIVIVSVEFGGICGCARCLRTYSRRE